MKYLRRHNVLYKSDIDLLHDCAIKYEVKGFWKLFDIERKLVGIVETTETTDNVYSNDDAITMANLESHAPFQNDFFIVMINLKQKIQTNLDLNVNYKNFVMMQVLLD